MLVVCVFWCWVGVWWVVLLFINNYSKNTKKKKEEKNKKEDDEERKQTNERTNGCSAILIFIGKYTVYIAYIKYIFKLYSYSTSVNFLNYY